MIVELADVADVAKLRGKTCRILLRHIMDNQTASKKDLVDALYGHRNDGGADFAEAVVRQVLSHIRKALRPGFHLERVGPVYRLEVEPDVLVAHMLSRIPEALAA